MPKTTEFIWFSTKEQSLKVEWKKNLHKYYATTETTTTPSQHFCIRHFMNFCSDSLIFYFFFSVLQLGSLQLRSSDCRPQYRAGPAEVDVRPMPQPWIRLLFSFAGTTTTKWNRKTKTNRKIKKRKIVIRS